MEHKFGTKRPGTIESNIKNSKLKLDTTLVSLAIEQLGPVYNVIKNHQPSTSFNWSPHDILLLVFVKKHWFFDGQWENIPIFKDEDKEDLCLQKKFSKMIPEAINNILNKLYEVNSKMYQILKDLLTGEESDETAWNEWLNKERKNIPSPYELGQLRKTIQLVYSHQCILESHQPRASEPLSQQDCDLLARFYHQSEYDSKMKFPIPKSGLQKVMDALSNDQFDRILDIFLGINPRLYVSFKKMITNQESVEDHRIYDQAVRQFSTRP
jgi:hypothetical protein